MDIPNLIGLVGAIISGAAYLPQIIHLIAEKCSAGISRRAYMLWFLSSLLITVSAWYSSAFAFIILGLIQIISTGVIYAYSTRYKDHACGSHQAK